MKYVAIFSTVLGLFLLYLLSNASANTAASGEYYTLLVTLNITLAACLVVLIVYQVWRMVRQIRKRVMGSRFTLRLLASFAMMALIPGLIVYLVSVNFLTRSIESWFNLKVEAALEGGLNLGRTALDVMLSDLKEKSKDMAISLVYQPEKSRSMLNDLREKSGIQDATLLTVQGRILEVSSSDSATFLPELPTLAQLRQAKNRTIGSIEPITNKGLYLRVLTPVSSQTLEGETRILQLLQPVPEQLATTAERVQDVYQDYQQLSYSRTALREVFALTLTLVMMLAMLSAVAIAFVLSRRLSAPLTVLAEGTKAIASGDYSTVLPAHGKDELGVLVQSFNSMTQQLDDATKAAESNRARVEAARGYLETILAHLSSGVIAFNQRGELRTYNDAAANILSAPLDRYVGFTPDKIIEKQTRLASFFQVIIEALPNNAAEKGTTESGVTSTKDLPQTQIELINTQGKQIITMRGTRLPDGGYVNVFDDATTMVQAQRDAAWGEVARRLAHEIKNPLTPIQLSAERMAHKLQGKLADADAKILTRSTETIVNQVDAMKRMVNEFSEYARAPAPKMQALDLNKLIEEVVSFYDLPAISISLLLEKAPCDIGGDSTMLRQVIHNLLQNAQDALSNLPNANIVIETKISGGMLVLTVQDNGTGFPADMLQHAFEPYITSKPHGTGLGLAIVKKIVEEHKGSIKIENNLTESMQQAGAMVSIHLPLYNKTK
ncbi:MAG TPA: ATP-binding protein [Methylotenera sp.]|nr:ATP-binding protein [Methylotenera sp.]HPH06220.1 ATP-binding protein [Methylotenera sp.]HPN00980.1 ATP-binding protein [Methylotenera sp.]